MSCGRFPKILFNAPFFQFHDERRNPRDYFAMFDGAEVVSADGASSSHLELVCCKCVDTYVTVKKNQNQICWKFQKV
jgi:phosphoethanolamine N-methyltransferase